MDENFCHILNAADAYKTSHAPMYPNGMEYLQSNFIPRNSRIPGIDKVVMFGLQAYLMSTTTAFERWFSLPATAAIKPHVERVEGMLGSKFDASHWYELHKLGYLPLEFKALDEGTLVPLRVPMFTVQNTVKNYGWLVNYFESVLSAEIWHPMTSATIALHYRKMLNEWAQLTSDTPDFVDWQGHDFSFRGMSGLASSAASGAGHLLVFAGSDTLPAMDWAAKYYKANGFVGGSVHASEHSIPCAFGNMSEREMFLHLMNVVKEGILSVVSDTWDLWNVITRILPSIKQEIMSRNGKVVIRPDSGDPVKILCGDPASTDPAAKKGVIELLWDIFGGTVNSKGYKVLDPHIGAIYGDSITYERANLICSGLEAKKFATTNVVLGVGSYTYQYVTRDTFGFAMKATWCQVDGVGRAMFKDPKTDNGIKKSARGRVAVVEEDGVLKLINEATTYDEMNSLLTTVWRNGEFKRIHTFNEIAKRVGTRKVLPS